MRTSYAHSTAPATSLPLRRPPTGPFSDRRHEVEQTVSAGSSKREQIIAPGPLRVSPVLPCLYEEDLLLEPGAVTVEDLRHPPDRRIIAGPQAGEDCRASRQQLALAVGGEEVLQPVILP